jgi:hypothetical protein
MPALKISKNRQIRWIENLTADLLAVERLGSVNVGGSWTTSPNSGLSN